MLWSVLLFEARGSFAAQFLGVRATVHPASRRWL